MIWLLPDLSFAQIDIQSDVPSLIPRNKKTGRQPWRTRSLINCITAQESSACQSGYMDIHTATTAATSLIHICSTTVCSHDHFLLLRLKSTIPIGFKEFTETLSPQQTFVNNSY